jgi:hypothetical protein
MLIRTPQSIYSALSCTIGLMHVHVMCCSRLASSPETRLIIAEHVLPLACIDEGVHRVKDERQMAEGEKWTLDSVLSHVEGADGTLAPAPLLPNLGKASANPYWMDIMVRKRCSCFLHEETSDCAT